MALEGKRTEPRDILEMSVEGRCTHAGGGRELGDDDRLAVVGGEPICRGLELLKPVAALPDLTQRIAHGALQQAIIELELVMLCEHTNIIRSVQKPDEAAKCVADRAPQIARRHRACPSVFSFGHIEHDAREHCSIEMETDAHIREAMLGARQLVRIGQAKGRNRASAWSEFEAIGAHDQNLITPQNGVEHRLEYGRRGKRGLCAGPYCQAWDGRGEAGCPNMSGYKWSNVIQKAVGRKAEICHLLHVVIWKDQASLRKDRECVCRRYCLPSGQRNLL